MVIPFTAVSAIVPSLLLVWFFTSRDVHPEPSRVLWATFGLGVLSIVPTLIVALPVDFVLSATLADSPLILGVSEAFFTAAIPEELFKLSVLWLYIRKHPAFDEPMERTDSASVGFAVSLAERTPVGKSVDQPERVADGRIGLHEPRTLRGVGL